MMTPDQSAIHQSANARPDEIRRPAPGRPPDAAKRRAILAATRSVFLASGFDGLSIEAVAAQAGVSKVTVYNQFTDRAGLLTALCAAESEWMEATLGDVWFACGSFRAYLTAGCQRLMAFLSRPDVMNFDAQMQLGAKTHGHLVKAFFAAGPAKLQKILHRTMISAVADQAITDAPVDEMTSTLIALLYATQPAEVRFGLSPPLEDAARDAAVALAVSRFLRLYAP
ncbi:TetR/AcrR family transcriptional regulator [Tabrizicola sp.]|uniref:TetR/AcrR family transcriptional regulator n=1 Tax=Tabrizicola sp. TaxID=2005166 RepID=UPI00286B494E|nr:TetR/AcrR family transcriptional regulator [Tabrizicola sp.]